MADPNKKRITIYLDLNIESDKQIWEFFEGKRKNEIIRPVLSNYINGTPNVQSSQESSESNSYDEVESSISNEELDDIYFMVK